MMHPDPAYTMNTKFITIRWMWLVALLTGYSIACIAGLSSYLQPASVSFILGVLALITSTTIRPSTAPSLVYLAIAIFFAATYWFLPSKTILFGAIITSVFFVVDSFIGRLNHLALVAVCLMSPIFDYAVSVFGFPIRLTLTWLAGRVMEAFRQGTVTQGNVILIGEQEYSVDPACMGLHMLIASLMAGVILMGVMQKRRGMRLSFASISLVLCCVLTLNIVSNFFRILCLVYFNVLPGTLMHDVVGLCCLIVYVLVPSYVIIGAVVKKFGIPADNGIIAIRQRVKSRIFVVNGLLFVIVACSLVSGRGVSVNDNKPIELVTAEGYRSTRLADQVTKLESDRSLVYIKPIAGFYASDHQPMICWVGSGYEFKKIREQVIGANLVYTATLERGSERLFTAWWYGNGEKVTISQLEWRWSALREGDRYALVNVTVETEQDLDGEVRKVMMLGEKLKVKRKIKT
jgi:exosortase N